MPSVTQKLAAANKALAAANARVVALEAWLTRAIEVYCDQYARIAELESQVAAGPAAATAPCDKPPGTATA